MPTTLNRAYLGTMPKGVSSPCGLVTVTSDPTVAPSWSAMSLPSTIGARDEVMRAERGLGSSESEGVRSVVGAAVASTSAAAEPILTEFNRSLTLFSSAGMMPLSTAPWARAPREISTCS